MRKIIFLLSALLINLSVSFSQSLSTEIFSVGNSNLPTVGNTFNVPVNVASFVGPAPAYTPLTLRSIDVFFLYDPTVVSFVGTANLQNVSNTIITTGSNFTVGMLKLNYASSGLTTFNAADGKLFDIQFKFLAGNCNFTFDVTTLNQRCKFRTSTVATTFITTVTNGSIAGGYINNTINSGDWGTSGNWSTNVVPNSWNNVTVGTVGEVTIGANAFANNLTVNAGAALTVNAGTLALTGNFLIKSDATATGSFINNGTYAGTATVQRYISAYTPLADPADGYRFVSSPVGNTAIGNFAPGGSDDFFRYNEVLNLWENYAVSSFGFTKGMGYLAAYAASATKSFTGTINDGNVSFSNLTLTPITPPPPPDPAPTPGWHLLGNPFTSAIKWNDGNWALSNVSSTAKVLNGGGSYTDLASNEIIPAMQGFLIQVTDASNAITIPAAARDHSSVNLLNKSTIIERLKLTASSIGNYTYVESVVKTDASATNGFDADFDANFLSGLNGAPQLYTNAGNSKLSTNVLPVINNNVVMVPVSFVAGSASDYKLTADGINTFNCSSITLLDLKTNTTQDLMSNPVYNFTASASDNVNRFQLYFNSTVGIGENNQTGSKIYSYGNDIYVNSTDAIKQVSIYNTIGQLIYTVNNPQGSFKYSLNGNSTGYYIVKVITDKNVNSEKVFVK